MKNLRAYRILDHLKQKKYCSMRELMEHFEVSSATIHRDIADLVARGALAKVRGGVAFPEKRETAGATAAFPFQDRLNHNLARKQNIARQALQIVGDGDILFLDSSTTVAALAALLENSNFTSLTIITNSLTIAQRFHCYPSHYVLILLGGSYDMQLNACLGQAMLRDLEQLSVSKAFVSAFGLCDDRVTTNHEKHFSLLMRVMNAAERKYLLIDRSKLGRKGLFRFATRAMFDAVITD